MSADKVASVDANGMIRIAGEIVTHGTGTFKESPPELEIVVPAMPGVPVPKILTSAIDRARAEGESRGLKLREIDLMTVSIFNDVVTPEGTTVLLYEYIASFSDAKKCGGS